mgnify:CR=1 FL=1
MTGRGEKRWAMPPPVERVDTSWGREVAGADRKDAADEGNETAGADDDEARLDASLKTSSFSDARGEKTVDTRFRERFE